MSSSSVQKSQSKVQRKSLSSKRAASHSKNASSSSHLENKSRARGSSKIPSPFLQGSHMRSSSNSKIKDKSLISLSSTPLSRLPSTGKLLKNFSIDNLKTQKALEKTKSTVNRIHSKLMQKTGLQKHEDGGLIKEALQLEKQLNNGVLQLKAGESAGEVYGKVFAEVIKLSEFGPLLAKIKHQYEETLKELQCGPLYEENLGLKKTLKDIRKQQDELMQEKTDLLKEFQKTSRTNAELCREVDKLDTQYSQLQDKFWDMSKKNKAQMPSNEEAWKYLVAEHKNYESMYKQIKKDFKVSKYNENKLSKLIDAVKKRGFPVEEVLKYDVMKIKDEDNAEDSIELTNLVEAEEPKAMNRPQMVPVLSLEEVEPNSVSSVSAQESEYYEDESEDN